MTSLRADDPHSRRTHNLKNVDLDIPRGKLVVIAGLSGSRLVTCYNYDAGTNNSTKSTPVITGDILGDWREEVVMRAADNQSLLLFSTNLYTPNRLRTLMHDPQYPFCTIAAAGGSAFAAIPSKINFFVSSS